jgi:hypothetical protein
MTTNTKSKVIISRAVLDDLKLLLTVVAMLLFVFAWEAAKAEDAPALCPYTTIEQACEDATVNGPPLVIILVVDKKAIRHLTQND